MNRTTAVAMAVAATAAIVGPPPAAQATYAGKRGPIVFQRLLDPMDESTSQLFVLSRKAGKVRRLTSFDGGAFAPEFSPNGRQIAFLTPWVSRGGGTF